jgi:hypothetical protein
LSENDKAEREAADTFSVVSFRAIHNTNNASQKCRLAFFKKRKSAYSPPNRIVYLILIPHLVPSNNPFIIIRGGRDPGERHYFFSCFVFHFGLFLARISGAFLLCWNCLFVRWQGESRLEEL